MNYIYDLETYPNFFLASFKNIKTKEWFEFEISDRLNETNKLRNFLKEKIKLIGFNNINFDYPVLHNTVLSNNNLWTAEQIYEQVEIIINKKYSSIWDNKTKIPQLDLFKIWHYDNKNKSTSLKWLEFALRWNNVEDLPYKPGTILTHEQMNHVIQYCKNDINATEEFFNKSKKHISIRQFYTNLENINLINASETKLAKEIFAKHLAKNMNIDIAELKHLRTPRNKVKIKDVIFDYIKFEDENNIKLLNDFKNSIWVDKSEMSKAEKKKHSISFSKKYKNIIRDCGEGGIHSFGKPGIYESNDEYVVVDVDFASYYPHLSFMNNLHPAHIPGKIFNKIYQGFYTERKTYPKSDPRNYVLKIVLNSSYGLSKDKYSFLYDPKWQLEIVINGQLILTMLTERIIKYVPNATIIFENTDGAAFRIKRSDYNNLVKACNEIETLVKIPLEIQECKKMIMRDVNNYINIITDDNIKFKGAYEIDRDYHKNHSKRIVAIAAANYFINKISIEDTILNYLKSDCTKLIKENYNDIKYYNNYGIFDFCIGNKAKSNNKLYERIINGVKVEDYELGKVNRYYISKKGNELIKKLPPLEKNYLTDTEKHKEKFPNQMDIFDIINDNITKEPQFRESSIEAGWKCKLFNTYKEKASYDIDYEYYIQETKKLINIK